MVIMLPEEDLWFMGSIYCKSLRFHCLCKELFSDFIQWLCKTCTHTGTGTKSDFLTQAQCQKH